MQKNDDVSKDALEFTNYKEFPAEPDPLMPGVTVRVLRKDADHCVRVVEYAPGTDASGYGVRTHDYREEVTIVKGTLFDLTLNREFKAGDAASRPAGMPHGPWRSKDGCIMYEVQLFKK